MRPYSPPITGSLVLETRVTQTQGVVLTLSNWGKVAKATYLLALLLTEASDE